MCKIPILYYRERELEYNLNHHLGLYNYYHEKFDYQLKKMSQLTAVFQLISKKYPSEKEKLERLSKIFSDVGIVSEINEIEAEKLANKFFKKKAITTADILVQFNRLLKNHYYSFQFIRSLYFDTTLSIIYYEYLFLETQPKTEENNVSSFLEASNKLGISKVARFSAVFNRRGIFKFWPKGELFFFKHINSKLCILIAGLFLVMSIAIFVFQTLSVFIKDNLNAFLQNLLVGMNNRLFSSVMIIFLMIYIIICAYFFLFKYNIKFSVGIKLDHKSSTLLLISTSSYFTYFTFPLCLNIFEIFIGSKNTAFENALGNFKMLDLYGYNILNYIPFIMILIAMTIFLNFLGRFLSWIGISKRSQTTGLTQSFLNENRDVFADNIMNTIKEIEKYNGFLKREKEDESIVETLA